MLGSADRATAFGRSVVVAPPSGILAVWVRGSVRARFSPRLAPRPGQARESSRASCRGVATPARRQATAPAAVPGAGSLGGEERAWAPGVGAGDGDGDGEASAERAEGAEAIGSDNPFAYEAREFEGIEATLAGLPSGVASALELLLVAGAASVGWTTASAVLPAQLRGIGRPTVAAANGLIGLLAARKLERVRRSTAGTQLANLLAACPDPDALSREEVATLEARLGASPVVLAPEEAVRLYGIWVEHVRPRGGASLRGDEAARCSAFKAALGLPDELAGRAFVDVGRAVLRERFEGADKSTVDASRRDLHRLIYVAHLVLGERAYLTPWTRACGVPPAQVSLARADGARELFRAFLRSDMADAGVLEPTLAFLSRAATVARAAALEHADAERLLAAAARRSLKAILNAALEILPRGEGNPTAREAAVREADRAIAFNRDLDSLRDALLEDAAREPEGEASRVLAVLGRRAVGPASLAGTAWFDAPGRASGLRSLLASLAEQRIRAAGDAWTPEAAHDVAALRELGGLGIKEGQAVQREVCLGLYRRLLDAALEDELPASSSPAAVLRSLVARSGVDAKDAADEHEARYRARLSLAVDRREISDRDAEDLARLQRLLCVPATARDAAHRDLVLRLVRARLDAAAAAAAGGDNEGALADAEAAAALASSLRLDEQMLRDAAREVGVGYLKQYATKARLAPNAEAVVERVKAMLDFADAGLLPALRLLFPGEERLAEERDRDSVRGALSSTPVEVIEPDGTVVQAVPAAWGAEAAGEGEGEGEGEGGDEDEDEDEEGVSGLPVDLAGDVPLNERVDVYRSFLRAVEAPKKPKEKAEGGEVGAEEGGDEAEALGFFTRPKISEEAVGQLVSLAGLLGLSPDEVARVHQSQAAEEFRSRAKVLMQALPPQEGEDGDSDDSPLVVALRALADGCGLTGRAAEEAIDSLQTSRMVARLQAAQRAGTLRLKDLEHLRSSGVRLDKVLSKELRMHVVRLELDAQLSSGRGEFDAHLILEEAPEELSLDPRAVARDAKRLAGERKRSALVQAASCLRQGEAEDALKHLNNVVACEIAAPSAEPMKWARRDEVDHMLDRYRDAFPDQPKKIAALERALGTTESRAAKLGF